MLNIILPEDSHIYRVFKETVESKRFVFIAGIPGVGKSLYVQQLAVMAQSIGRKVHLFQYDVTRMAFENCPIGLIRYPEIDGFTHPTIRKALGVWARKGVVQWHTTFADPKHILIGELPLVGNRLIEMVQKGTDSAEELLAGDLSQFYIPVPSERIRNKIEAARQASIENPRNAKEVKDAPPNVLQENWEQAFKLAQKLGLIEEIHADGEVVYDPAAYAGVFEHLLQHRPTQTLHIDLDLKPQGSVYDLENIVSEPHASAAEADAILTKLENQMTPQEIESAVNNWYDVQIQIMTKIAIISCSLHPQSRSYVLAQQAHTLLQAKGIDSTLTDLRDMNIPMCDATDAYDHPDSVAIKEVIKAADAVLMAFPIYNYDGNAAAKNLMEIAGSAFNDKVVGFMCAAGGQRSFMSAMGLANNLMLDFRVIFVPRYVYAVGGDFGDDREETMYIASEKIMDRMRELVETTVTIASALKKD